MAPRIAIALGALACVTIAGCGRIDFGDVGGDASVRDDARVASADAGSDAGAQTPWTIVQVGHALTNTVTIAPVAVNDLIVVAGSTDIATVFAVNDNAAGGGDVFTLIPAGRALDHTANSMSTIFYAVAALGGATTFTMTGPSTNAIVVWDVSGIRTASPLQTSAIESDVAASTSPVAASIATTAPGELVIDVAVYAGNISGEQAGDGFTDDVVFNGDGWSHVTSTGTAPGAYAAGWQTTAIGTYCTSAAAFLVGP